MKFTTEAKIEGACAFIRTLHETAGCSAEEIKRLLHPKIIDEVVAMCARRVDRPVIGPHGQVLVDQGNGANRAVIGPYGQVISRRVEGDGE